MAIDKALGQAPMGLNDQLIPPPDDMFSGIEIEIEDPEAVRIGIDGQPILEIEKEEIDELIDFDGTLSNSKIPIHDPTLSPTKTMDQTVFSTRQAGNPLTRGYRVYYGESLQREHNFKSAYGWEETEHLPADETIEVLDDMGVEEPVGRALEFGKDPKLDKKKKKGSDMRILTLEREKMIKVLEDILTKKSKDSDVHSKELKTSKIFIKNLKSLKKMAEKEGLSTSDIIKLMKDE